MEELREESGTVTYTDPLTSFFYQLLRDHMPAGEVEKIINQIIEESGKEIVFTNGWLAQYANNLAQLLKKAEPLKLKQDLERLFEDRASEVTIAEADEKAKAKSVSEEIEDDDLAAIKKLVDDNKYSSEPDEYVKSTLEESKAALDALVSSGQISAAERERIEREINEISGEQPEEENGQEDAVAEQEEAQTEEEADGRESESKDEKVAE